MIESVQKETCGVCRKDIDRQLEKAEIRLANHDTDIVDLKIISEQLLILQKQNSKIIEEIQSSKLRELVVETSIFKNIIGQAWFKYIIITICILTITVIGAAIGQDILSSYLGAIKIAK